jgi:hypothetical protein
MPTAKAPVSLTTGGTQAATCAALGAIPVTQCTVSGDTITLMNAPGALLPTLPSITLGSHVNIVLTASSNPALNSYDISSLTLTGQSSIAVSTPSPSYGVHVNFSGLNPDGTPVSGNVIDFQGGAGASDATFGAVIGCATCSVYDAKLLQFIYGGTGNISMVGNSAAAATFYAPKATATMSGTSDYAAPSSRRR